MLFGFRENTLMKIERLEKEVKKLKKIVKESSVLPFEVKNDFNREQIEMAFKLSKEEDTNIILYRAELSGKVIVATQMSDDRIHIVIYETGLIREGISSFKEIMVEEEDACEFGRKLRNVFNF